MKRVMKITEALIEIRKSRIVSFFTCSRVYLKKDLGHFIPSKRRERGAYGVRCCRWAHVVVQARSPAGGEDGKTGIGGQRERRNQVLGKSEWTRQIYDCWAN